MNCWIQRSNHTFVPCIQEYLNFKGTKPSKSRGAFVEVPYFLSKYDPDALRFYLSATFPETRDTEACPACPEPREAQPKGSRGRTSWSLTNLVRAQAKETSWSRHIRYAQCRPGATWANTRGYTGWLSCAYKRFDGKVPEPGELDAEDRALLAQVEAGFETVGELYNACKFRAAPSPLLRAGLGEGLGLAREANGYAFVSLSACLNRKAPWFQIKEDPQAAARACTSSCGSSTT